MAALLRLRRSFSRPGTVPGTPSTVPRARAVASATLSSSVTLLASVLKPLLAGYVCLAAAALLAQRKLQYFPLDRHPTHPNALYPHVRGLELIEEHEIVSADGTKCYLWHWPAPAEDEVEVWPYLQDERARSQLHDVRRELRQRYGAQLRSMDVLQFHGNAGSRESRLPWMQLLRDGLGCSVTILDYRGYGGSDGTPTERGLIADGEAAYRWLRARQQQEEQKHAQQAQRRRRPVLWGESIGSGVAIALVTDGVASAEDGGVLVLEAGFTSCVDLGAAAYPFLPVRLGMIDRFESERRANKLAARGGKGLPLLSLHGELDEIAPIAFGRRIFDALPSPRKQFVRLAGTGHNDVPYHNPALYLRKVAQFLDADAA